MQSSTAARPNPTVFILDVDGVMTDGTFYYDARGKVMKRFGADDHDGLLLLTPHLEIRFVTADSKGFAISHRRIVDDMHFPLDLVSGSQRGDWIAERYNCEQVIYMGDGIFDHHVMQRVAYGIAPANSDRHAREHADFVTSRGGGDRAVAEACLHILERFFKAADLCVPRPKPPLAKSA